MKNDVITSLPIIPEEYDAAHIGKIDFSHLHNEMTEQERRFVNGLIRWYRPENLLEAGVSRGGGTVNLLNAISDMPSAKLTSIDRLDFYCDDTSIPVGADVSQAFLDLPQGKWNLIAGKDYSEVMDTLSISFDFAVIDTMHLHPIESLNFLSILPCLKDGAIVVFHDIMLFANGNSMGKAIATRILISCLACQKLFPKHKETRYMSDNEPINNIVAVQITADTRKYIGNIFQALALPWETYPYADIKNIRTFLAKHYSDAQMEDFEEAVRLNASWIFSGNQTFSLNKFKDALEKLQGKNVMFYGAGQNMNNLLAIYDVCNMPFDYPIWDIDAKKIGMIDGHTVSAPDFTTKAQPGSTAIITIASKYIEHLVQKKLENVGWTVINGLTELFYPESCEWKYYPVEFTPEIKALISYVKDNKLSMVSDERLFATAMSCKYVIENKIDGDFVECGVWRGGNAILAAGIFKLYGQNRKVWLFDTFEGFIGIEPHDMDNRTQDQIESIHRSLYNPANCGNSIEDVKTNFERCGVLNDNIVFCKGDVMSTLETDNVPAAISVLRLDTDWYESSKKELEVLYPKLSVGGVLMLDDYGYVLSSRIAADEYFTTVSKPFLQYIDSSGRLGIKLK